MFEARPLRSLCITLLLLFLATAALAQENRYGPLGGVVKSVQSEYKEFVHQYVAKDKTGGVHVNAPNLKVDVTGPAGKRKMRVQAPFATMSKTTTVASAKPLPGGLVLTPRAQAETRTFLQAPMVKIRQFIEVPAGRAPSLAGAIPEPMPVTSPTRLPIVVAPNPEGSVP